MVIRRFGNFFTASDRIRCFLLSRQLRQEKAFLVPIAPDSSRFRVT